MQQYDYQHYQQTPPADYRYYPPYPPYQPYPPAPPQPDPKQLQRRELRKTANGLGFFILVYYFIMQIVAIAVSLWLSSTGTVNEETETSAMFVLQIIASIASSLIAVFFYRLISGRRLSINLPKSRVKPGLLIPMVLLGMAAAMVANQMANLFDQNISLFELENSVDMFTDTRSVPEMILYIVSTAIVPALAEELAFRGVFMNIMRKYGDPFAIISSSILFGAMHGNTTQIIFAFVLGLIFAYVDCKTNSILPSVIIHFTNNFYAVVSDIFQSNKTVDEGISTVIYIAIVVAFCLMGVLSYFYLAANDPSVFRVTDNGENRFGEKSLLTLREKFTACFTTAGVIISLVFFISEMMVNLLPTDALKKVLESAFG